MLALLLVFRCGARSGGGGRRRRRGLFLLWREGARRMLIRVTSIGCKQQ